MLGEKGVSTRWGKGGTCPKKSERWRKNAFARDKKCFHSCGRQIVQLLAIHTFKMYKEPNERDSSVHMRRQAHLGKMSFYFWLLFCSACVQLFAAVSFFDDLHTSVILLKNLSFSAICHDDFCFARSNKARGRGGSGEQHAQQHDLAAGLVVGIETEISHWIANLSAACRFTRSLSVARPKEERYFSQLFFTQFFSRSGCIFSRCKLEPNLSGAGLTEMTATLRGRDMSS